MSGDADADHKIVILGAGTVGKSAITIRMVGNTFEEGHEPTIEDRYQCDIKIDDKLRKLDILDTAGQEQFSALRHHWIREGEAFLLVYSVDSMTTFDHTKECYKQIGRVKEGQKPLLVLVGNKSDLDDHEVSYSDGEQLAREWDVPFIQTSAKTGANIRDAFEMLIREILKYQDANSMGDQNTGGGGCCHIL